LTCNFGSRVRSSAGIMPWPDQRAWLMRRSTMAAAGAAAVLCLAFLNAAGVRAAGAHAAAVARAAAAGGIWGKAEKVPGLAALNQGGFAEISSVSCASAGNCAAVGFYSTASLHHQAFVVSEVKGAWGRAEQVPGLAALDQGRNASL